jgi:uncharacterized membrane protein YraQ (UPF0718 family)
VSLPLVRYTVLRLVLFVASLALLWLVGVRRSVLLLVLAALVSMALSYLLLRRQRDEVARALADRVGERLPVGRAMSGLAADADAEDAEAEAAQTEAAQTEAAARPGASGSSLPG